MAAKTSTPKRSHAHELLAKLLKSGRFSLADPLGVRAAIESIVDPPVRNLRQLVTDGTSVSAVARKLGVARSTLREQLDASDMQLSTLDKLLEVQGYDLEVIAVTPEGTRFKVGGFGST